MPSGAFGGWLLVLALLLVALFAAGSAVLVP